MDQYINEYNAYTQAASQNSTTSTGARRPGITTGLTTGFSQARSCHTRR